MIRYVRIVLALLFFIAITMLFLDFTGVAVANFGWLARIQVIPALLSLNFAAIVFLALLTLVFGRVYCSVICPLGVYQDIVQRLRIWLSGRRKRKIGVYKFHKALSAVRYTIFGVFALLLVLGFTSILASSLVALIEPYSMYGRMASGLLSPLFIDGNNALAEWAAENDSYAFYTVARSVSGLLVAIGGISAVVVGVFAALTGRGWCNTVCPVGTLLGFLSRYSLLKPRIDTSLCNGCRSCERHCKAECINAKAHEIDYSRCVVCMDCINHCTQGAIKYTLRRTTKETAPDKNGTPESAGRRTFMALVGMGAGAAVASAADKLTDGGFTELKERKPAERANRVVPAGSGGTVHVSEKCVGCQLCIQACPNGVLKTSGTLDTLMQPYMDFRDGYCTPECTLCSTVCPAGVFKPIDEAEKSSIKIGTAKVNLADCLYAAEDPTKCGNCARHCPTGAIAIVPMDPDNENDKRRMPVVDENACIGCGACEYHCPVGTVVTTKGDRAAIHVEGIRVHRII